MLLNKLKIFLLVLLVCFCTNQSFCSESKTEKGIDFNTKMTSFRSYATGSATKEASKIGADIIENGGNAIDALVGMQTAISLTEMHASGFGGGGYILYFDKKSSKIYTFDGRETAPSKLSTQKAFRDKGKDETKYRDEFDINYVAIPGNLKLFNDAHKEFGKLKWEKLIEPTVKLAENGFRINPRLDSLYKRYSYNKNIKGALVFDTNSNLWTAPNYIQTLKKISDPKFVENFYSGEFAKKMVNYLNANESVIEYQDFQDYKINVSDSTCINYKDYKICTRRGNFTPLLALKLLEKIDFHRIKNSKNARAEKINIISKALNIAIANKRKYYEDCFTEDTAILEESAKINFNENTKNRIFQPLEFGDLVDNKESNNNNIRGTTAFYAIDREGNVAIATTSVNGYFGSSYNFEGIYFNNTILDFSDIKDGTNSIEKNKRPASSISPIFVFDKNGKLIYGVSSAGGIRILTFVVSSLIDLLEHNSNPQEVINDVKYSAHNNLSINIEPNRLSKKEISFLKAQNHNVIETDEVISGLVAFRINYDNNGNIQSIDTGKEIRRFADVDGN